MTPALYYPYKSEALRDSCFGYLDERAEREWPVPSETRTVPTSFGPTFVRISGPAGAPPLMLLPGASAPSLMWVPNVGPLSIACRTYAVDVVSDFGRSLCTRAVQCFADLIPWMHELLDGLGLGEGINLAGVSYGGALAAEYALQHPERTGKVILLAPGNTVLRVRAEFMLRLVWAAFSPSKRMPEMIRWIFADAQRKDPQWVTAAADQLLLNMRSMQRRKVPHPRVWSDAEWARLQPPTLFLVGEHEVIYPAQKAVDRLRRVAPAVTAEIVPGAGHDLTFSQADLVNRRMLEFLQPAAVAV